MEQRGLTDRETHPVGEIVEYYSRASATEVVETYARPMPGGKRPERRPPRKHRKTGLVIFLFCLALVLAGAVGAFFWNGARLPELLDPFPGYPVPPMSEETAEITIPAYTKTPEVVLSVEKAHGRALSVEELYTRVNPAVVTVVVQMGGSSAEGSMAVGTGVIFSTDGYILTNYHVLEGGRECAVALEDGRTYPATYVAGDQENDLAVVKVEAEHLPVAEFGDSDLLTVGDPVYAIGNPLGVELRGTLTDGIVSAINRDVWVDGRTMTLIQTNAALNSGNSGGPLINLYGQVVGINTIKMSSNYSTVEGLGFAIPSASIRYLVYDLLTYGEVRPEPLLGISVMQIATQLEEDLWGLEVLDVSPGSAADRAGIRVGDYILACGDTQIKTSQDLLRLRRQYRVGDEMLLTIWHDGTTEEVALELTQSISP